MKVFSKTLGMLIILTLMVVIFSSLVFAETYEFYFVSHIGPADPNMKWLTTAIKDAEEKFPVKVNYSASATFSVENMVNNLNTAVAAEPDGIIIPIVDPAALEGPLNRAVEKGIPVIAVNIEDPREGEEKIKYLTYIGGDEYKTGLLMGARLVEEFAGSELDHIMIAIQPGHVGLEARARGMIDYMQENRPDVKVERLAISDDPATTMENVRGYLTAHDTVDAIWNTQTYSVLPCFKVVQEMGLDTTIEMFGVDESPLGVEGILKGNLVAVHSQQFYLQGYLPVMWLYLNNKFGFVPPAELQTGPVIVDEENAQEYKDLIISVMGEELYNELGQW